MAALVVLALLGIVPMGASTHESGACAKSLETVVVGTGDAGIDLAVLNGVNHRDIAFPPCSSGRFWIDHSSDPILTQQHCADKFLRVYAPAGAVGHEFVINWSPASGCA